MQKAILTVCLIFLSISMFSQTQNGNDGITISKSDTNVVVTDLDGNTYPTKIMKDGKRWMTKSLNVELPDSWCYENDPSNCNNYGRLYTLEAAKKACKSLGEVWRLPSKEEWTTLALSYGGIRIFESRWIEKGNPENALNSLLVEGQSGFSAQLGGMRDFLGLYDIKDDEGLYWSDTDNKSDGAWYFVVN